jgi:hypothetical protein
MKKSTSVLTFTSHFNTPLSNRQQRRSTIINNNEASN